jgi:hypothetical protein
MDCVIGPMEFMTVSIEQISIVANKNQLCLTPDRITISIETNFNHVTTRKQESVMDCVIGPMEFITVCIETNFNHGKQESVMSYAYFTVGLTTLVAMICLAAVCSPLRGKELSLPPTILFFK